MSNISTTVKTQVFPWIKCLAYLAQTIAVIFIAVQLYFAHSQLIQAKNNSQEEYITHLWNEVVKSGIEFPAFNDQKLTRNYQDSFKGEQKIQYYSYARWIGGFIEDLYNIDYEAKGWTYYEPTIDYLVSLHCSWLGDHVDLYSSTPNAQKKIQQSQVYCTDK